MADNFPDIPSKLGNPTKKSFFERQREEAEAKKAREKAETAAVLEDFVKSFDDDEYAPRQGSVFDRGGGRDVLSVGGSVPGPGKRHFTSSGLKSGPGSLGPSPSTPRSGPGSLASNTGFGKKRAYEDFKGQRRDRESSHGMFSYEDDRGETALPGFHAEEDEARKDSIEAKAAKPTLHLSSLPPGTSPAVVKSLFIPSPLIVENVRILSPQHNGANADRKSTSAIVTLASETPATDIDTIVSHLQNKYLGFGFNLSISRHLSSAALSGTIAITAPSSSLPFNARPVPQTSYALSRAPPPGQTHGRFAPPASYTSSTPYGARSNTPATQVSVSPPSDLSQLKLIHKTLEALLTHGPEFEALLMSLPQIQRSERWSWLFNSRSAGGIYYRWRLWDTITDSSSRRSAQSPGDYLFEGQSIWIPPEQNLKFEYTTEMEEFVSSPDYDSSDEEDDDGGIARRYNDHTHTSGGPPPEGTQDDGTGYLNPLAKTKLVHLLARLPKSNAKLRRGDVARVTGFAIEHAGSGADEVVDMITANVVRPFATTNARGAADTQDDTEDDKLEEKLADASPASLVGLYVISDILSSSASEGVRHAWRYRALFEAALRDQGVFERLGRIDKDLGWGKLKAEKWKRSIQSILTLWEGWCVFPQASHDLFVKNFLEPPLSQAEKAKTETEEKRRIEADLQKSKGTGSKWKTVDHTASQDLLMQDVDSQEMANDDVDGQPMNEDDEMIDDTIDGVSMVDSSDEEAVLLRDEAEPVPVPEARPAQVAPIGLLNPRQRPRAVDMFADEDSGGEGLDERP